MSCSHQALHSLFSPRPAAPSGADWLEGSQGNSGLLQPREAGPTCLAMVEFTSTWLAYDAQLFGKTPVQMSLGRYLWV